MKYSLKSCRLGQHCIWCGHDVEKLNSIQSTGGYHVNVCDSCLIEYDNWIDHDIILSVK